MPQFAANISLIFTEHDFIDRIEAAYAAGFQTVKCPYSDEIPAPRINKKRGLAGSPGRYETDAKALNTPVVFDKINAHGHDGWTGCQYKPRGAAADTPVFLLSYRDDANDA